MHTAASAVDNPLLHAFLQHYEPNDDAEFKISKWRVPAERHLRRNGRGGERLKGPEWEAYMEASSAAIMAREQLVHRYAWAIPNDEALDAIAALSPIVEVGAGTGYWANLLAARGAEVRAFDTRKHLAGGGHTDKNTAYYHVAVGDEFRALRMYPEHTLLLCWPPFGTSMAANALRLTRAQHVVWVGEIYGCTGTDAAYELLGHGDEPERALFEEVNTIEIPQWYGLHDHCAIYERK